MTIKNFRGRPAGEAALAFGFHATGVTEEMEQEATEIIGDLDRLLPGKII